MTAAVILIVAVVLLLVIIAARASGSPDADTYDVSEFTREPPRRERWEKDHFTQKHLHRDDEKHQRHKRNQIPR